MNNAERRLARIIYSMWDFQQALSALTFLMENCDFSTKYNKEELRRFKCYESQVIISMSRPFVQSRGKTIIGLGALGIYLTEEQKNIKNKVLNLRKSVIAHSDEEHIHFRVTLFQIDDWNINFPHFQFNECLLLDIDELDQLESLLHTFITGIAKYLIRFDQDYPGMLARYVEPISKN